MRRSVSVTFSVGKDRVILNVPGELSFDQLSDIICRMFGIDGDDHVFSSKMSKEWIGPKGNGNVADERHRYLSAYEEYPIEYLTDRAAVSIAIADGGDVERDCPSISESSFAADRAGELDTWFDDEYYLLPEIDGNPYHREYILREELTKDVASALRSEESLDFYFDIENDCLAVLADANDDYECITREDAERYDTLIPIRGAEDVFVYKAASEYSGSDIKDHGSYVAFREDADSKGWELFLSRKIRDFEREWVKDNDLWVDLCDLDELLGYCRCHRTFPLQDRPRHDVRGSFADGGSGQMPLGL